MTKSSRSIPVAVEEAYNTWIWLDAHIVNLPSHVRAATGARILLTIIDVMAILQRAAYEPRGSTDLPQLLRTTNQQIALLRLLTRGLRDRHQLSPDQHAHVAAKLDALGRMVGGWIKSLA